MARSRRGFDSGDVEGVAGPATSDSGPLPCAFTARILNRYSVPLMRLETVWLMVVAPLLAMSVQLPQAAVPAFCWTWYLLMLVSLGFVHESVTCAFPGVAMRPVGFAGFGGSVGVAGPATSDSGPLPCAFTARILNRYSVPLMRLETVWLMVVAPLLAMSVQLPQAAVPAFCWTWYLLMLVSLGFVHESVTCAFPGVAMRPVGFAGFGSVGVAGPATSDSGPLPCAFTARILNRYSVPLMRLETVWLMVVAPLLAMSVQLPQAAVPAFCWTWYLLMLVSLGFVHESVTCAFPGVAMRPVGLAGGALA